MKRLPAGVIAISAFFLFGAIVSAVTLFMLLVPRTKLDGIWRLNPQAHDGFVRMGSWALLLMLGVGVACSLASLGLSIRSAWGYRIALGVLALNLVGDVLNAIVSSDSRVLLGLPVGGAMIAYLLRSPVKRLFITGPIATDF